MKRGYIKLWRKFLNHRYWEEKRVFSRAEAWIYLIVKASGKDKKVPFDGKMIQIKRGQLITSKRKLAEEWGWCPTKTRDFLKYSQNHDHSIELDSDHKKTIITIVNYETYNPLSEKKKTTPTEEKTTTERPLNDHRLATSNKDKEGKNKVNKKHPKLKYSDAHLEIAKFLEERIMERLPRYQIEGRDYLEKWANEARIMEEKGEATFEEMKRLIIWIYSKSAFWSKNILSFEKFRKQFGRLWADMEDSGPPGSQVGKSPPSLDQSIPDSEWQMIAKFLYDKGASEWEVARVYYTQKKIFPKIADQWEKSDKRPETFLGIINGPETLDSGE